MDVKATNKEYHLKQLRLKRNEKVNYQIYTAMEVFKVEKAYLYIIWANETFDIESFRIEDIVVYERQYFFEECCVRFV